MVHSSRVRIKFIKYIENTSMHQTEQHVHDHNIKGWLSIKIAMINIVKHLVHKIITRKNYLLNKSNPG